MKDDPGCRALDVQGPAVLAAFAAIRHQRVGPLLALPCGFQLGQRLFQSLQIACQRGNFRSRCLTGLLVAPALDARRRQLLLAGGQLNLRRLQLPAHSLAALLDGLYFRARVRELTLGRLELRLHLLLLGRQSCMQRLGTLFPLRLVRGLSLPQMGCGLERLGTHHGAGAPIQHQQQQNERSHGAEKHREERKSIRLVALP
jgi:hypothetical protein